MGVTSRLNTSQFAIVWASAWLKRAAYRRRPSGLAGRAMSSLLSACAPPARTIDRSEDYFSQLANVPDLPQSYRARALSIVMHQRRAVALQRLIYTDEA
jgi:hypothetical protein